MIKLTKSTFYRELETKKALTDFIKKADILSFSTECKTFEKNFAAWQERKYVTFVNSGSSANLAVIQSLVNLGRLKKGDKVGFSAITWSTNVMPLIQLGLVPVPIDVELDTLNISARTLSTTLEKHDLKMLFVTNLLGLCSDLELIAKTCTENNCLLIEDNCESLGSVYQQQKLGNFGLASTFSFYVGHHMSTIEGGCVATDDKELRTMLEMVRAHGWDRNMTHEDQKEVRKKHKINSTFYSRYTFYDLGFNLRPTEISGFLGNYQLKFIDEVIDKRQQNFMKLAAVYQNQSYFPLKWQHLDLFSCFAVPIITKTEAEKTALVKKCSNVVEIRPIVGGDITQQPFFNKYFSDYKGQMTNASIVHKQGLYFANNPELTNQEMKTILEIFG